jgi:hypothetical protein
MTLRNQRRPLQPINAYLPVEIIREIFLFSIEVNQASPGDLASVCQYWRSIINTIPSLWSTLKVGAWTERERVATWLQRARLLKVVIDTERDGQGPSPTPPFAALQDALISTGEWHELTISSFPADDLVGHLDFRNPRPMNVLKALHVAAGCMPSGYFTHLLDLVPAHGSSLSELRLYQPFATAYFLQPHRLPALQFLTVLIVNGRDIHGPFQLLPAFTQLHVFEADHLPLPIYEPNANLPLVHTLRKLQVRSSSVQWMAGRQFLSLEECVILFPHHWSAIQHRRVELPYCRKLAYHGYPMTVAESFCAPQMRALELGSHDSNKQRVYQQLQHLCRSNVCVSKLTALHLTLQCSQKRLFKVFKNMESLEELVLCISYPSSFGNFLLSLAAEPSSKDWPILSLSGTSDNGAQWKSWCSSQTWHANILPSLKYLGIQSPKGLSMSQCLDILPLLRTVTWTRSKLSPPLEHLKVWESRGTTNDIVVDCTSAWCLNRYIGRIGTSRKKYDSLIVRGMVTQCLAVPYFSFPLFGQLYSTVLFRRLHVLILHGFVRRIPILPYLDQIKELSFGNGAFPEYSLNIDLPLVHTLQRLKASETEYYWMLGRSFKVLEECSLGHLWWHKNDLVTHKGRQVYMPACKKLYMDCSLLQFPFFSCPNLQTFDWISTYYSDLPVLKPLFDFLFNCPHLQNLHINIEWYSNSDDLIRFVFCNALEEEVWHDIRSVEVVVRFNGVPKERDPFLTEMVGRKPQYEKWWNVFIVTTFDKYNWDRVKLSATM